MEIMIAVLFSLLCWVKSSYGANQKHSLNNIFKHVFTFYLFINIFGLQYQEFKKEQEDKVLKNGQVLF